MCSSSSLSLLLCLQPEEYDMMVRELGFEMKAQPSEKMKSPEELAREEKEKLQKLEASKESTIVVVAACKMFSLLTCVRCRVVSRLTA